MGPNDRRPLTPDRSSIESPSDEPDTDVTTELPSVQAEEDPQQPESD